MDLPRHTFMHMNGHKRRFRAGLLAMLDVNENKSISFCLGAQASRHLFWERLLPQPGVSAGRKRQPLPGRNPGGLRSLPAGRWDAVLQSVWRHVPSGDPPSTLERSDPLATQLRLFPDPRSLRFWFLHGLRLVFGSFPFQFREDVLGGNYIHGGLPHGCIVA